MMQALHMKQSSESGVLESTQHPKLLDTTKKEKADINVIRASIELVRGANAKVVEGNVDFDVLLDAIACHAGLPKSKIIRMSTHGLGFHRPEDAFRIHCADIVTLSNRPLTKKEEMAVKVLRATVELVQHAEPAVVQGDVRFEDLLEAIERHTRLTRKRLVRCATRDLGLAHPCYAFRIHCADLVTLTKLW